MGPLLVLHWAFQLLMFSAYHLACGAPAPFRRAAAGIAAVSALVVATEWARAGFQALEVVLYGAVTVALALFVAMMQAIHEQNEQRGRLLEQLEAARGELAAAERRAGVLAERERLAREIHDTLAQGFASIVTLSEAARAQARLSPQAAMRRLEDAGQVARASLAEARRAIWALRPEALERGLRRVDLSPGRSLPPWLHGPLRLRPGPPGLPVRLVHRGRSAGRRPGHAGQVAGR